MSVCRSHVGDLNRLVTRCFAGQVTSCNSNFGRWYLRSTSIGRPRSRRYARHAEANDVGNEGPFKSHLESKLEDTRDIYIDDLDATLEAHRATNRAKIIRRTQAPTDPAVKHFKLGEFNSHAARAETKDTGNSLHAVKKQGVNVTAVGETSVEEEGEAAKPWDYWPAGTIQYRRLGNAPPRLAKGSIQEYRARAMIPTCRWRRLSKGDKHTDASRPWLKFLNEPGGDALQRLANEIIAFERYMRPSIDETKAVKKAISEVEHVINSTLDRSSCQVMGSYSTGLAMPWSDIDFAIALPAIQEEAETHHKSLTSLKYQKIYRRTLFRLEQSFARSPNFTNSPKVIRAHIPIVQVTHRRTGLQVQVQIQTGPRQQQQYILAYLAEYPTLRLLYFILRSCLELRRLNITFEGGLGSYSILMMIVNALKHASGRYDAHDVANQLLHVLEFYANSDLYRNGFSVDPPRVFRKARLSMTPEERMLRATDPVLRGIDSMAMPNPRQRYLLCLQDPADLNNDLGSKAYAIKHIQATFGVARKTVLEAMEAWNRRSDIASEDAKNTGLLDALVGGNYRRFNADRDKVKEYGSSRAHGLGIRHSSHKGVREGVERKERKYSAREMLEKVIEVDKRKAAAISEKTQP